MGSQCRRLFTGRTVRCALRARHAGECDPSAPSIRERRLVRLLREAQKQLAWIRGEDGSPRERLLRAIDRELARGKRART